MELIVPMRSETDHLIAEMNCLPAYTDGAAEQSPKEGSPGNVTRPVETQQTTTVPSTITPQRVHPSTAEVKKPQTVIIGEQRQQMTNPLYAFANVDEICPHGRDPPSSVNDQFAPIISKICASRDGLASNGGCFAEAARSEEAGCVTVESVNTSCSAIEQFTRNIDCVIKVMEEACPAEVYEIVAEVRERLNDEAIAHKCYLLRPSEVGSESSTASNRINDDGFSLTPTHQRCNSDQESAALICLTELVEVNKRLAQMQSSNLLFELSDPNSTLVSRVCELYDKYERCLGSNVFSRGGDKQRCAFNSPLNTLAR